MVDRSPVNMELSTHAAIARTAAEKGRPAKHPGTPTKKVTPGRSPSGDNGNKGAAKAASPFTNEKTTLKQITVRMTPKGCFETLKHCEEKNINDEIDEEVRQAKVSKEDHVVKHLYIDSLLRGLDRVT